MKETIARPCGKRGIEVLIKCGECGETLEIPDDTVDGQHFICPFCGLKTAYRKSARIELPNGADKSGAKPKFGVRRNTPAEEARNAQDALMEGRLRLAINPRPNKTPESAPKGVLTAAEERVKMYEEMRRKDVRQKMVRNFVESAMLLMSLAAVIGLALWWQSHRNKVAAEAARIEAEAEADRLRLQQENDRLARERREKDRQEREAACAREEERRRLEQAERERRLREEREAKALAAREKRDAVELYHRCLMAFKENIFDFFGRSVTNGLETSGGELCYLLPAADMPPPVFDVVFETNGTRRITRIEADGRRESVEPAAFDKKLEGQEYIVAKGDKAYFRSARKSPAGGILNYAEESDPAETFFGTLAPTLKEVKPSYYELTFDIFFTPRGSDKRVYVENLPFGCAWSRQKVREAVEDSIPAGDGGTGPARSPWRRFKRTVKLWDGPRIKRGVDGITYVPRTPPPERVRTSRSSNISGYNVIYERRTDTYYNDRPRWHALHERAVAEDAEEEAFYAKLRRNDEQSRTAARAAADEEWCRKVENILRNGTLSYRIRKAKVRD